MAKGCNKVGAVLRSKTVGAGAKEATAREIGWVVANLRLEEPEGEAPSRLARVLWETYHGSEKDRKDFLEQYAATMVGEERDRERAAQADVGDAELERHLSACERWARDSLVAARVK
jgi:hypothetical protein